MLGDMNYNQNGYYDYNWSGTVTRKAIVDYMKASLGTENVVSVDEFETMKARHVCKNSRIKKIVLLDKTVFNVPTVKGYVPVEVFWCPECRELIVNKSSLDIL